jgi:hypothetical protein
MRATGRRPTPASSCASASGPVVAETVVHPPRPGQGRVCCAGAGPSPSFPRVLGFYMFYFYFYALCKKLLYLNEK